MQAKRSCRLARRHVNVLHRSRQKPSLFEEQVLFPIKKYTFRLALAHNLTPPISVCSVSSSLNLLRVCSQWLSVADVWRLQYSTGTHISQRHAEKGQTDADAADDVSTDAMREFLSSGLRFGPQFGVIDSILLQL